MSLLSHRTVLENKSALLDLSEEFHDIDNFYHQRPTWKSSESPTTVRFEPHGTERMPRLQPLWLA